MRERRNYLILMGAILAALIGAVLLAVPGSPIHRKPTLGLDLRGGLEVVLKAVPPKGHKLTAEDLDRSVSIMENRINKLGVSEPEIRKQGTDQIVIQLAGVHDPAAAAKLIGKTATLQLFDFENDLVAPSLDANGNPSAQPTLYGLLAQVQAQAKHGTPESYYLFKDKTVTTPAAKKGAKPKTTTTHSLLQGPAQTKQELLKQYGGKQPKSTTIMDVPAHREVIHCAASTGCLGAGSAGVSKTGTYYYLVKYYPNRKANPIPELTGGDLVLSGTRADFGQTGQPVVLLQFTNHGSHVFQRVTKEEWERGKIHYTAAGSPAGADPSQFAQHFAIVLDGELKSTPYIDFTKADLQNGIAGGAEIDMGGSPFKQAQDLALVLQTGALPVSFQQIERTDVSATLGKESLHQAIWAAVAGLAIVAVFLLVLYRFLGLVAVLGLAVYGLLYYAAILLFNVTLTLPGFAGLILTIAVALDANVVTAITALVLFLIAVASVKGFALMLLIGTVISLLTAVAATRAMLGLLSGFRWFHNPRFMGAHGQQTATWLQIDFMRRRYVWFALSGLVIVAGAVSLGVRGLNLGIDFKGGTQVAFKTHVAHTQGDVAGVVSKAGYADAIVQGRGAVAGGGYKEWQIRTKSLTGARQSQLTEDLTRGTGAYAVGVKNVSASFGHQIATDAIWGILVSLGLIVVYITLRFDLKFAIPVILAMLHDILITVGVYSIAHKEVSVATVAAVLTVLGYSIYDTIIIFDRIRENIPLMRRQPFATITNVSLWETIRRSLATTFITLLPIVCLEILGGSTLKDFAFALIVGVTSGAYSSIFVAAPLLTIWKEREPEYAKRRGAGGFPESDGDGRVRGRRRRLDPGTAALAESEAALAEEPTPELVDVVSATPSEPSAQARREKRRQRRRSRPHGRAR